MCGRGFGKTLLAIQLACMTLELDPNAVGLFLEPDWKRVRRVFLKKWLRHVPKQYYTLNKTEQCITWHNGALLFYGPRNITGANSATDDAQLGQDTTFIIDDEAALRCSHMMYINNLATVREPSRFRYYLTLSTPRPGDYADLVNSENHVLFTGTSLDNPYRPEGYVRTLVAGMSASQVRRDILGELIALEGLVFPGFDGVTAWPKGNLNVVHRSFDPSVPWYLFCDLGSATGAYIVVQPWERDTGTHYRAEPIWTAVADYTPYQDASATRAFSVLAREFGTPVSIVAGADVNTRGNVYSETAAEAARKVWGEQVTIHGISEKVHDKQAQFDTISYGIKSYHGERRFAVGADFVSLEKHPRGQRGLVKMFQQYCYRDEPRSNEITPKGPDQPLCHVADALMMGAYAVMWPRWAQQYGDVAA